MAMPKDAVRIDEDGRDARGLRCCEGDVVRDDAVRMPDLQIRLKRSRTGEIRDEADVPTLATPKCADSGKFEQGDITMLVGTVGEPVARAGARMPAAAGGAERSAASAMGGALL